MSKTARKTLWYAEGLCFSCTQCGNCCSGAPGYVWVDLDEVVQIADFLDIPVDRFTSQHVRRVHMRLSLLELPDGDCEFLERHEDGRTTCAIHPVRPLQCRTWPFWKSNLSSAKEWKATGKSCPGLNTGQHHPLPVIQKALKQNDEADLPL